MIYPCPKPPKGRAKPEVTVRMNKSDGALVEIRHSHRAWEIRREEVAERAGFLCEHCNRPAPLHDEEVQREEGVMPLLIRAGQAAHIRARKMGGGSRNDAIKNLRWLCGTCHRLETEGKLVIE